MYVTYTVEIAGEPQLDTVMGTGVAEVPGGSRKVTNVKSVAMRSKGICFISFQSMYEGICALCVV